jgi:hypothetical protein
MLQLIVAQAGRIGCFKRHNREPRDPRNFIKSLSFVEVRPHDPGTKNGETCGLIGRSATCMTPYRIVCRSLVPYATGRFIDATSLRLAE